MNTQTRSNNLKAAKYTVSQIFETLGDPCKSSHATLADADEAAITLRVQIAEMVATWQAPVDRLPCPLAMPNEVAAWDEAARRAGVHYDAYDKITSDSPTHYGATAGRYIADEAVRIDLETPAVLD